MEVGPRTLETNPETRFPLESHPPTLPNRAQHKTAALQRPLGLSTISGVCTLATEQL